MSAKASFAEPNTLFIKNSPLIQKIARFLIKHALRQINKNPI
jgi:hypothetical protein